MKRMVLAACLLMWGCDRSNLSTDNPKGPDGRNAAQRAYDSAASTMHTGMGAADRDPDVAFAQGMIPHHRGAVQMALIQLRHGKDPELRKLARAVLNTQQAEIAQLEAWLQRRDQTPSGSTPHEH